MKERASGGICVFPDVLSSFAAVGHSADQGSGPCGQFSPRPNPSLKGRDAERFLLLSYRPAQPEDERTDFRDPIFFGCPLFFIFFPFFALALTSLTRFPVLFPSPCSSISVVAAAGMSSYLQAVKKKDGQQNEL